MGMNEKRNGMGEAPSVQLHIEELLLQGFSPRDRFAISDALEQELTRLIVNGGRAGINAGMAIERLECGRFKVAHGMKPGAVGRQIAQTLYRGIGLSGHPRQAGTGRGIGSSRSESIRKK